MTKQARFIWLRVTTCGAGALSRGYVDADTGAVTFTAGVPRMPAGKVERGVSRLRFDGEIPKGGAA